MSLTDKTIDLMAREQKIANKAVKAGDVAREYLAWYMDNRKEDIQDSTNLVIEHTGVWGVAQLVLNEIDTLDLTMDRSMPRSFRGKISEENIAKTKVLRSVMMSKLLYELFVKDTNYKQARED